MVVELSHLLWKEWCTKHFQLWCALVLLVWLRSEYCFQKIRWTSIDLIWNKEVENVRRWPVLCNHSHTSVLDMNLLPVAETRGELPAYELCKRHEDVGTLPSSSLTFQLVLLSCVFHLMVELPNCNWMLYEIYSGWASQLWLNVVWDLLWLHVNGTRGNPYSKNTSDQDFNRGS
jgi:hypothetical protein